MTPSAEQLKLLAVDPTPGSVTAVKAFAGSGKTCSLVMFAESRPDLKMLYLAYNRSMREEADSLFPKNVTCKTTHQLCYKRFGAQYAATGKLGELRLKSLADVMPESVTKGDKGWGNISAIAATLSAFTLGNATSITEDLAPTWINAPDSRASISRKAAAHYAEAAWNIQRNVYDDSLNMTHDGYLKLYQLDSPDLDYDVVLFDECQDANPATLAILLKQPCALIMVGDPHQQIYAFRGSDNAFGSLNPDNEITLTGCWRFGPDLADLATNTLRVFKQETATLRGLGPDTKVVFGTNNTPGTVLLARTNSCLLELASQAREEGVSFGFLGGFDKESLRATMAVWQLKEGREVFDNFVAGFRDFKHLSEYAEASGDNEMAGRVSLVKRLGASLPPTLLGVKNDESDFESAELRLCTAHKAKGLAFDSVELCDDFVSAGTPESDYDPPAEEANLLYVAMTRARKELCLCPKLAYALSSAWVLK